MTYKNRSYGRCSNGVITEYAPSPLHWSKVHTETWTDEETGETHTDEWTEKKRILHPAEQDYNDMGWFRIDSTSPTPPEGQHVKSYRHEQDGNRIVRVYEYEADVKVARRFSVFAFEIACFRAGILAKVDEFIDSQTITDENTGATMPLRRAYERVTEFVEDNPYFAPYYQAGLAYCGLTAEQGESILANCVMD